MKLKTLSTLILCAASMQAVASDKSYWVGSDGDYARGSDGKCVRTVLWTEDKSIDACEGRTENVAVKSAPVVAQPAAKEVVTIAAATAIVAPTTATSNQTRNASVNYDQARQDRIAALKVEQQQRRADMFAQIKKRDAERLDRYKASQDQHIERLRSQQEKMIKEMELRNKESYELRAARVQSNQSTREEILNRI